jgi:hypothetical protein
MITPRRNPARQGNHRNRRTSVFIPATTGQQIADAVNWAIVQGAPIQLGTVDHRDVALQRGFQKGITCADVIKSMFRKEPDFVMDWDSPTMPFPRPFLQEHGRHAVGHRSHGCEPARS